MMHSSLFDETTFYDKFITDLNNCTKEVIIESPYITTGRMNMFMPIFKNLLERKVKIYIMTREPKEHSEGMEIQSEEAISQCERMGVQVLLCIGNHHRKLAILDREVLWEGSLNILSQNKSREIMRRMGNKKLAVEMFNFLKLYKFV
jgi:phosphatidylserine/phosphatidylglycerophosphate/cardiolipin synthase-like enzyme